jgi:methionyl-tRNA synthetase
MLMTLQTNKYITDESPWSIAKSEDPIDRQCVLRTVYHCAEALRVAGILLQPFMPGKAKTLLDTLGVHDSRRTYDDAQFGVDASYGEPRAKVGNGKWDSLFPPLSVEYGEM